MPFAYEFFFSFSLKTQFKQFGQHNLIKAGRVDVMVHIVGIFPFHPSLGCTVNGARQPTVKILIDLFNSEVGVIFWDI